METSRSSSRSRRSYPNLHNLSLAPLSSKYPFDAATPDSPSDGHLHTPHLSYIAHKSAPTTPGILSLAHSRSNSRNGRQRAKGYAYDSYFRDDARGPVRDAGDIPKASSTDAIAPGVSFAVQPPRLHHARKATAPLPTRKPLVRRHTSETNDEWFHRAGLAIAGEMRDSKGQGWLVRRESSSSLVQQTDGYEQHTSHDGRHVALLSGEHLPDLERNHFVPRISRAGSRINSRVGSRVHTARNSRRGSRAGSGVDLFMSGMKSPTCRHSLDLDENAFTEYEVEPDFVEADEDSGDDEEEVARLARERGFGLGGWMDKLIGWTLFSVDEDGEDSEDEDGAGSSVTAEPLSMGELKLRREVEAKRRKLEREAIMAAAAVKSEETQKSAPGSETADTPNEDGGGWSDAAWLLTVASKVIL
jgi:hypothetical protein